MVPKGRHPDPTAGALWLATALFFLSQRCRELAQSLPRTCREPMPKTSAAERRPANFHLQSSLHGATATVARRPDPNLPNIKMKGRRCPPLGASDRMFYHTENEGALGPETRFLQTRWNCIDICWTPEVALMETSRDQRSFFACRRVP